MVIQISIWRRARHCSVPDDDEYHIYAITPRRNPMGIACRESVRLDHAAWGQPIMPFVIATECTSYLRKNATISARIVPSIRRSPASENHRCSSAGADCGACTTLTATLVAQRSSGP